MLQLNFVSDAVLISPKLNMSEATSTPTAVGVNYVLIGGVVVIGGNW
jgi:hypothetical protein